MVTICLRCAGERFVCEAHPTRPWGGTHGCSCGAPGVPCPICNRTNDGEIPELPEGFVVDVERGR